MKISRMTEEEIFEYVENFEISRRKGDYSLEECSDYVSLLLRLNDIYQSKKCDLSEINRQYQLSGLSGISILINNYDSDLQKRDKEL